MYVTLYTEACAVELNVMDKTEAYENHMCDITELECVLLKQDECHGCIMHQKYSNSTF